MTTKTRQPKNPPTSPGWNLESVFSMLYLTCVLLPKLIQCILGFSTTLQLMYWKPAQGVLSLAVTLAWVSPAIFCEDTDTPVKYQSHFLFAAVSLLKHTLLLFPTRSTSISFHFSQDYFSSPASHKTVQHIEKDLLPPGTQIWRAEVFLDCCTHSAYIIVLLSW